MKNSYNRIMIFGRPGSGKSTFAARLSKATGLELHHLDRHFYRADWVEVDYGDFMAIQEALVAGESWIIDGNNTKSLETRYARADLVVYFSYSRLICYWRVFKRFLGKDSGIKDRAAGCRENVRWSLLKYMWSFQERVNGSIQDLRERYPEVNFVEVTNDVELKQLEKIIIKKGCL